MERTSICIGRQYGSGRQEIDDAASVIAAAKEAMRHE